MDRTAGNATEASDIATETDVLIIGAGPVGLTLALLLAARGRTVAIYEQHEAPYPLPRAVGMSHDSVRTYQAAGVLPRLDGLLDIQWRDMVGQFTNAEGEVLFATTYPGRSESGYPTMTGFNQPDLEAALERCCRDDLRITTHRGWRVEALTQQRDQVLASLTAFAKHDGGAKAKPITAAARFVVGCDGANSSVASLMATTVTDTGFASSWLVVDIVPKTPRIWDPELGQSLDPARPITIVPAGPGRRRFELMALPGETPEVLSNPATVWPLLAKFDVTPENAELVRSAFYTFRGRWANEWRDGRILLAGDAAHQMPPFLGQGFNSGIRDVMALAWRLDRV
jgi:2-polyprenyl-6-methoxyphenol hydroxylase-like FAD-dependent oxidoreductase